MTGTDPLERQGPPLELWAFALCPATPRILVTVFGGTAAGAVPSDHIVLARLPISAAWIAGTWRGVPARSPRRMRCLPAAIRETGPFEPLEMTFGPANAPSGQVQS